MGGRGTCGAAPSPWHRWRGGAVDVLVTDEAGGTGGGGVEAEGLPRGSPRVAAGGEVFPIHAARTAGALEEPLVRACLYFALTARFQFQQQLGDTGPEGSGEDDVGGATGSAGQDAGDQAVGGNQRVAGADDVPDESGFGVHVRKGRPLPGGGSSCAWRMPQAEARCAEGAGPGRSASVQVSGPDLLSDPEVALGKTIEPTMEAMSTMMVKARENSLPIL